MAANANQALLTQLKGVGPKLAEKYHGIGLTTIQDVLFHLPHRYQDKTRLTPIIDCRVGETVNIEGNVISSRVVFGKRRQLKVIISDQSAELALVFYYFNQNQQQQFVVGKTIRVFGKIRRYGKQQMIIHPEYRVVEGQISVNETLTPVYPTSESLQQKSWLQLTEQALQWLQHHQVTELLPTSICKQHQWPSLSEALATLHRPTPDIDQQLLLEGMHPLQQRLVFEELLAQQLSLRRLREKIRQEKSWSCQLNDVAQQQTFMANLHFQLTDAQQRVHEEITSDLQQPHPMMRLIQGDVGSGKTVVAALAALTVINNQHQVAVMAPTELLAEQHYYQFKAWFEPLSIATVWLTGKLPAKQRRDMQQAAATGQAQCVVGTHALFQKSTVFARLGLVIVDEQHRFGVAQRQALLEKGLTNDKVPHQLIMTATPIPRTLAMSIYADLDTSVIDQLPPGRTPIETRVINNNRRDQIIERVVCLCQKGQQAYWVCPLIKESEQLDAESAEQIYQHLQEQLPEQRVGLVHGKMKAEQKQAVMQQFKEHQLDVLVATTVIEVGINVPNATLMVIENPERMGLAQLHQLRGRVGRGAKASHCILLYQEPLSTTARKRLEVMRESTDGFFIAERDLRLRGSGEMLGTKQTGLQRFRVADLLRDRHWLPEVRSLAKLMIKQQATEVEPLIERWIGQNTEYAKV